MKIKLLLLAAIFLALFIGCRKDDNPVTVIPESTKGVYVVNEGIFNQGNAELTLFIPDSNITYNNVFSSVNGKKLGDVAQNMYIKDGVGYIVVNNSNKIVLIDTKTNKLIDTISTNLNSPRAIVFSNNKMYVSNLYGSSISVFSGTNYKTFVKNITVKANPDEMLLVNSKIYVVHPTFSTPSTSLTIIDPSADVVSKIINVGYNPTMLKAYGSSVAVLCTGEYGDWSNPNDDIYAKMYLVNNSTDLVSDSITVGGHPMDFAVETDYAYVTGDAAVMKIDLKNKKIDNANFIPGYYYSIAYEPINNLLYIGDAKNFASNGEVLIYNLTGTQKTKFTAGFLPGSFCFNIN
jgi:YVTN family beta-propeller protein